MKRTAHMLTFSCFILMLTICTHGHAQKRWDGGAGDGQWSSALNWQPDGVPTPGEDVLLDNLQVPGSYAVTLPAGRATITLNSLTIKPHKGDTILLDIPTANTAIPAIDLSSATDALLLDAGAILRNGSGAASGETILLQGQLRILDGGHYIHRTVRANAYMINHLASDSATTHGVFEFDVPGTAGYTVSLTGNIFGDLRFSATAAGGSKSYSGSGSSDLIIQGHLQINSGVQITSTLTADIHLGGDLTIDGLLNLQPVTAGVVGRSLLFGSTRAALTGSGTMTAGPNFRNLELLAGSTLQLRRDITLPYAGQSCWVRRDATLDFGNALISGSGAFHSEAGATIHIGDASGITTGDSGNLRTAIRQLDPDMTFIYDRTGAQSTGDALPPTLGILVIDKPLGDIRLSRTTEVRDLSLLHGHLYTTDSSLLITGTGTILSMQDGLGRTDEGWDGSYVNGPCVLRTGGTGTWRFPIGDGKRSAPIVLRRTEAGEVLYTGSYHSQAAPTDISNGAFAIIDDREYWSLRSAGNSPQHDAFIDLPWHSRDWPRIDTIGAQNLRLAGLDSGAGGLHWTKQDVSPLIDDFGGSGWIHGDKITGSFRAFTLAFAAQASVLAMTGSLSCTARPDGDQLIWNGVLSPGESLRPEYSPDGVVFEPLAETSFSNGNLLVNHPSSSDIWYRVSVQHDGRAIAHSNTCSVRHRDAPSWRVSPQPSTDHVNIEAPFLLRQVSYKMVAITGEVLQTGRLADGQRWTIRLERPSPGIRILQIIHHSGSMTRTIIIGQAKG